MVAMRSLLIATPLALIAAIGNTAGALGAGGAAGAPTRWLLVALGIVFPALGWLLATRRPAIPYGWLLLATAVCLGLASVGTGLTTPLGEVAAPILLAPLTVFFGLTWIFLPLLFPDGRLPSRRWRPVAWLGGLAIALHTIGVVGVWPAGLGSPDPGPLLGILAITGAVGQTTAFVLAVVVLGGLVGRWRRSNRPERGQYAWMVAGVAATLGGFVAVAATTFQDPFTAAFPESGWQELGLVTVIGALPAAIGVAIVRHRLLGISIARRGSRLHLVFEVRPSVGEVLAGLGNALADAPEPVEQLDRLAAAVRTALDTRWAAVALDAGPRVVAGTEDGEAGLTVTVPGGRIETGARTRGRLAAEDRRLLEALAVPAGLAIQGAGLAARLVNAQEAERRRIERNIHDGVQQQLVALIAGLELARATGGNPTMLAGLREQARRTLDDLRELAAGIHPSALTQGGLVEAVEARCGRLTVPVKVTASAGLRTRRFPDDVEGAVYFTVSEAVANALKHAGASRIAVALAVDKGRLTATVTDDGAGFDPADVARRGLATLVDRLDALGGTLDLTSAPGEGTRVTATVPTRTAPIRMMPTHG